MFPFSRKKSRLEIPQEVYNKLDEENSELLEVIKRGGLEEAIDRQVEAWMKQVDYYEYYNRYSEQGNFYGSEFDIIATAGRLKGLYTREPWISATANLITKALAIVPFVVKDKATDEILDSHPLYKQLEADSHFESLMTMRWNGSLDLLLGGNYFEVFDDKFQTAVRAPVERTTINLDKATNSIIESITIEGTQDSLRKVTVPYEQVVHWKFPNPFNVYYGMSIFTAASRPILLDRMKNEFEMAFYLRGATNAGVIETTEDISKSRMERLLRTFEQLYTGKRNWFRTIFLPKSSRWVKSGLTMQEMQHLEGLKENRLLILAVLGIPPSKVGIVQDVNRSTSDNQDKDFWTNTIEPLAKFMADGWNNSYLVKKVYKDTVEVCPDFSNVEALQESLEQKGDKAQKVDRYLTINEIRKDIFGYDPLLDDRGDKFVSEIGKPSGMDSLFSLQALPKETIPEDEIKDTKQQLIESLKAAAVSSQERLERKLGDQFIAAFRKYVDILISAVETSLRNSQDVRVGIKESEAARLVSYKQETLPVLESALLRGFSFASAQSKGLSEGFRRIKLWEDSQRKKKIAKYDVKKLRFNETDQQAIEVLRDAQEGEQLNILQQRAIENFVGFDKTTTEQIMGIVADKLEEGESFERVAAAIREEFTEAYKNQSFTVARTEILSATSQGIKWNKDILGEVFTKVEKQWFHVGDVGSNPDARENHFGFEQEGAKETDYMYGGILEYPRDPSAPADEIINCRCTLVSVIPDDAESNADIILENI